MMTEICFKIRRGESGCGGDKRNKIDHELIIAEAE